MAAPQKKNGYTAIANEIMDALCHIRIPGEERQVLDSILRKTYGWNKAEDSIALSQFTEMTGLNKSAVVRAINGLLSKKIITVIEKDNEPAKTYRFIKDYEKWVPLSKKITLSKKKMSVVEKDNPSLSKKSITKDTTTKDTLTKATAQGYTEEFLAFYQAYPNRKEKIEAFKSWLKLGHARPSLDILLTAIKKQISWRTNAGTNEFRPEWKNPSTWLNRGCWEDDLISPASITYDQREKSDYMVCPKCKAEVRKGDFIEIGGESYCSQCTRPPQARGLLKSYTHYITRQ